MHEHSCPPLSSEAGEPQLLSSHEQQMIRVLDVFSLILTWHLKTATGIATGSTLAPAAPAASAISEELCVVFQSQEMTRSLFAWLTLFSLHGFVPVDFPIHPFPSLPGSQELTLWINLVLRKIFLFNWKVDWGTQEIGKSDWNKPCTRSNTHQHSNSCIFDAYGNNQMASLALTCFLPSVFSSAISLCGSGFLSLIQPHILFNLVGSELTGVQHLTLHYGLILLLFQLD